jgi:hypothetical protein
MLPRDSLPLVAVAHPDPGTADALRHAVESTGDWRAAVAGPGRDALTAMLACGATVAIVGCARLGDLPPGNPVPVLAIGDPDRPGDLGAAGDARAEGLLPWPDGAADLAGELSRLQSRTAMARAGSATGSVVVAVAGVQGGAGTTTLASHLAGAWARWGSGPVLLADLAGGLGFRLDLSPTTPTWTSLTPLAGLLESGALARTVATPWPGLSVIPLPGLPDGAPEPRPTVELLRDVVAAARRTFHTIVLDVPPSGLASGPVSGVTEVVEVGDVDRGDHRADVPSPDPRAAGSFAGPADGPPAGACAVAAGDAAAAAAICEADVLLMVARPESAGLTALETADAARAAAGIATARAGMVVMGAGAAAPVAPREVRARLGDRLWALVPASAAELAAAAEDGLLLLDRPEVPAVQAMLALAHRVVPFTGAAVAR